jgi:hypothetical protein
MQTNDQRALLEEKKNAHLIGRPAEADLAVQPASAEGDYRAVKRGGCSLPPVTRSGVSRADSKAVIAC